MRELLLDIDETLGRRAGLEQALRLAIRNGQLEPGTVLPSTRAAASDFGLSRATVVAAYDQLKVEGYLVAQPGSGTKVGDVAARPFVAPAEPGRARPQDQGRLRDGTGEPKFDFRPGQPDLSLFPRSAWMRSIRRVGTDAPDSAFGYPEPRGCRPLRRSLAEYLARSRAVFAEPSGVSIYGGAIAGLGFVAETLREIGVTRIGIEDPSLFLTGDALRLGGLETVPIPVDNEGLIVEKLSAAGVGAVLVTPSHQYPLGVSMTPGRRAELLQWANEEDRWIVEDDYDGEFRYDRQPVGALQGLDPDRVIYVGTASKSMGPGLRLAWCVAPRSMRPALARTTHLRAGVSSLDQLALADFIDRGSLDVHLRKMRAIYHNRHRTLTARLRVAVPWLELPEVRAGLHLTAMIAPGGPSELVVAEAAQRRSVGLMGLGVHWVPPAAADRPHGLVLGFSRPAQHRFAQDLDRLLEVLVDL